MTAIVFDMGETLFDETRQMEELAAAEGMPRFTYMALVGAAIVRGEQPRSQHRAAPFTDDDFYPNALPCLAGLRARGLVVGVVGNTAAANEDVLASRVDFVGSSERWGISKPAHAFFERIVAELDVDRGDITYVGDRVDNDVLPALACGLQAVHIRRGPWGHLHETPAGVRRIDSLSELLA